MVKLSEPVATMDTLKRLVTNTDNKYATKDSLSTVATSGNYSDLKGTPASLPANGGTAAKLSTNAGSTTQPVYFANGVPVATAYTLSKSVPADAKFTDTVYTLPDATATVKGGIKVGSNLSVSSGVLNLTKDNITTALGYTPPTTNTDTHYTTGLKVGASAAALANAAATNGNVYLNVLDNTTVRDSHNIIGDGATSVTSDANGKITISSTNTIYTHPSSHPASMITGLAAVATSGNYNDLSNKPTIPTIPSSLPANGGTATTATKLATARTISLGTGATGTATSFDGSANITIPVTTVKESYLDWGGKNFSGSFGCIDAAMISDLGANRLAFGKAAGIKAEYSTDGGSTWTDYGLTDGQKISLFSTGGSVAIGKASTGTTTTSCMLRITVDTDAFGIYTVLNKFVIYLSTNGCTGTYCTIDASLEATPTTFKVFADKIPVSGWTGYNVINVGGLTTYGNSKSYQYGLIRFTFGCTDVGSNANPLTINRIMGFGGVGWSTPSNMAKNGHLYTYDNSQNATFPAQVTATQFNGTLNGSATKAMQDGEGNNIRGTYLKGSISYDNSTRTITVTRGDGATFKATLPEAGPSVAGLVKVGTGLSMSSGVLNSNFDSSKYMLATDIANNYLGKTANAVAANKLTVNAGSATSPTYFSNGVPTACTGISVATVTATTTLNIPGGKIWIE